MRDEISTLGGLNCFLIKNCEKPDLIVIVCHGYGANKEDLSPIGSDLLSSGSSLNKIWFVFPDAPLTLQGQSKAWWPIDMNELMMKVLSGDLNSVFQNPPPGLPDARSKLMKLIEELKKQTNIPTSHFVLSGFSQGSMLATDVSLHLEESPGGLVVFSGVLISEEEWTTQVLKRKGMKVMQTHGKQDPLLPFALGSRLKDFFEKNGMDLSFTAFSGGHTIAPQSIGDLVAFLLQILQKNASKH